MSQAAAAVAGGGDAEEDGINARTGRKQRVAGSWRKGGREGEEVERHNTHEHRGGKRSVCVFESEKTKE